MKTKTRGMVIYGLIIAFLLTIVSPGLAAPSKLAESINKTTITSLFKDVTDQNANLAFINYLNNQGIIKGFPDGSFHPNEGLTRAQAASIMVLAGNLKVDPSQASPFADVRTDHWARSSIAAAVQAGYISGFPDKTFHPEENLSRAQAVSMLLRLSKQSLSSSTVLPKLSDMNSSHWAAPAVAVGIASGMLGLSADQQQVYPERAITRGDLSRALSVLLTQAPDLSSANLVGEIQVKSGTVTIQSSDQAVKTITGSSVIVAGDIISTDKSSEADISYNDGSGLLLKGDSRLIIKEARGRSYIKADGSAGIAIDWLLLDLQQGQLFGALATSSSTQASPTSTEKNTTSYLGEKQLLASLNGRDFMAAAPASGNDMPWYEASKTKKVKVEVDMPWGVAAIRGTFWNNIVNTNGSGSTSILTGSGEVTAGGQTVSLGAGQITQGTSANTPPAPAQAMIPSQMGVWAQVAAWAQQRAEAIQQNQAAPPPNAPATTPVNIVQTINQAISASQAAAASLPRAVTPTPTSHNSPTDSSTTFLGSYTLTDRVTVADYVYDGGVLTQDFSVSPPADLAAQTYYYELYNYNATSNSYVQLGNRKLISEKIRHLKKLFAQTDNLRVFFFNSINDYQPLAVSGLSGTGLLTNISTKSISGTISLPTGTVAPAGGLKIDVYAHLSGIVYSIKKQVIIPAGANSITYTFNVPVNASADYCYYVDYEIPDSYNDPFISCGKYPNMISVIDGNKTDANMNVLLGKRISGTISLPNSVVASQDIKLLITAGNNGASISLSDYAIIPQGQNSASYAMVVPAGYQYKISYLLKNYQALLADRLVDGACYSNNGMIYDLNQATPITVNSADVININLSLQTGYIISGTVNLPSGKTAPAGGTDVWIQANSSSSSPYMQLGYSAHIAEGASSVNYQLVKPNGSYTLSCYANQNSLTSSPNAFTVNNADVPGINQTLLDSMISPGPSPDPDILTIDQLSNGTIIIGKTAFSLNCANFNADIIKTAMHTGGGIYYKSSASNTAGLWFDLQNTSATDSSYLENPANQASDSVLPAQVCFIPDPSGGTLVNIGTNATVSTNGLPFHLIGDTLSITVSDADRNQNSSIAETVSVQVKSSATDTTGFSVTLTETGMNTGEFTGSVVIDTVSNSTASPQTIGSLIGENILIDYNDALNSAGSPHTITGYITIVSENASLTPTTLTQGYTSPATLLLNASGSSFDGTYSVKIIDKNGIDTKIYSPGAVNYTLSTSDPATATATVTVDPGLTAAKGPYRIAVYKAGVGLFMGLLEVLLP